MIALLSNGEYIINGCDNINDFLIEYVSYLGCMDTKVFKILVHSNEMTVNELVEYINRHCYPDEDIVEIYELGKKFY